MHRPADTMSYQFTNHRKTIRLGMSLYSIPYIRDFLASLCLSDTPVHGILCDFKKPFSLRRYFSNRKCPGAVSNITIQLKRNINRYNVTFFELSAAWNGMNYFVIHADTCPCWEGRMPSR